MFDQLRRALRRLFGLAPILDLHGFGVRDAVRACEEFLSQASAEGLDDVKIVYGKGRHSRGGAGVLRHVIPRWLDNEGSVWIESYRRVVDARGEDGAVLVRLRRR